MEGSPEKKEQKSSMIAGRQPVIEALEAGRSIDKILLQANTSGDIIGRLRSLAKSANVPIQTVPAEKLNSLTRINHQGVIALAAIISYSDLHDVVAQVQQSGKDPLFVMLDGITDVRNIGAIARSALCCGAQALVIPDKGVGALNEDALKASAGALENIHVCRVASLLKTIDDLHLAGILVYVSQMKAEAGLEQVNFNQPCCIVMGSEGKGVQNYIAKAADTRFSLKMSGNFDSFNVSVATGIILYEAMKQRL